MTSGTVVVLPSSEGQYSSMRGEFLNGSFTVGDVVVADGPPETEAARICAAISAEPRDQPLTIVAFGRSALHLPSVALAQRAAHRRVREYLLVDPQTPAVTDGWPDAHVSVFSDGDQTQARLRGWSISPLSTLRDWIPAPE